MEIVNGRRGFIFLKVSVELVYTLTGRSLYTGKFGFMRYPIDRIPERQGQVGPGAG